MDATSRGRAQWANDAKEIVLEAIITRPIRGNAAAETMPEDAYEIFYTCKKCSTV